MKAKDKCMVNLYALTHGRSKSPLATIIHPNEATKIASKITIPRSLKRDLESIPLNKKYRKGNRKTKPKLRAHNL